MSVTEGELSAAKRLYDPKQNGGRSFEQMLTQNPAALTPLVNEARFQATETNEFLDWLELNSTIPTPSPAAPPGDLEMPAHLADPDPHSQYALFVSTDGAPGRTIFRGAIDPNVASDPVVGDVWIDTSV